MSRPTNIRDLHARIVELILTGPHEMPDKPPFKGTGAPGHYLESLLGFELNSRELADALGHELKWYTDNTSLVTLFHCTPDNSREVMRDMVLQHGKLDGQGRLSFRHTVSPNTKTKGQKFRVSHESGFLVVRGKQAKGPEPRWSVQKLQAKAGAKLRQLLLVKGQRTGQRVTFLEADHFKEFSITDFIVEVERGNIVIDFDVRESQPGSTGLRDHGTKFRIPPIRICSLYMDKHRLR